jgi:5'-nucleotidase
VLKQGVDLVVSGINHGPNMGTDILYSGTVAAALDAVIMGYNALAVSCCNSEPVYLDAAAEVAAQVIGSGLFDEKQRGVLYNLNVPDIPYENVKGIRAVRQSGTMFADEIDVRSDPRGREYVWMSGRYVEEDAGEDTDAGTVNKGYAAITPLRFDLTDRTRMDALSCRIQKIKLHI